MLPAKHVQSWKFPFTHWNWKVAAVTAAFRGIACIVALRHVEMHARQHFGVVEAVYVLLTSGFFSALQQQALNVKPRKLAWFINVVAVPVVSLGADSLVHLCLNHVNAHALGIGGLAFTLVSAMFHWHIMQNGVMLVGKDSNSLISDLKQIPKLLLSFLTTLLPQRQSLGGHSSGEAEVAAENELELVA